MKAPIKILAIDNHPLYTQGMCACFRNLSIVAKLDTCRTIDEMRQKIKEEEPHLVFVELNLDTSRYDGFYICREITTGYKNIFIAVLSRYNTPQLIQEARKCGARAFFDKSNSSETLCDFLHDFRNDKIHDYYIRVAPGIAKPHEHFKKDAFELKYTLTKREREVMILIVDGKEHCEIETELFISYNTFKTHRSNILRKLELKNEVELTLFAIKNNL